MIKMTIEEELVSDILKLLDTYKQYDVFDFDIDLPIVGKGNILHIIIKRRIVRAVELIREELRQEINKE